MSEAKLFQLDAVLSVVLGCSLAGDLTKQGELVEHMTGADILKPKNGVDVMKLFLVGDDLCAKPLLKTFPFLEQMKRSWETDCAAAIEGIHGREAKLQFIGRWLGVQAGKIPGEYQQGLPVSPLPRGTYRPDYGVSGPAIKGADHG